MEKKCFKCGEVKSLSSFYRHPSMSDGHVNKCKECNKKDVRENRFKKEAYYRKYDRSRGNRLPEGHCKKYREKYPLKYKAHSAVRYAINSGKLHKEPCQKCGSEDNPHAHHDDYAKPLNIRWLCAGCHSQWHKIHGEAKNVS